MVRITRGSFSIARKRIDIMERCSEAHIPTVQSGSQASAWFPCPPGHQGWPSGSGPSSLKGTQAPVRLRLTAPRRSLKPYPNRAARLRTRRDFLRLRGGRKTVRPGVVVQMAPSPDPTDQPRAGFTASRKVGNAVARNRSRRRLKEAVRHLLGQYGVPGHDYVFIARQQTAARPWTGLLDDVKSALISLTPVSNETGHSNPDV